MPSVSNAVTKYGGHVKAVNKEALTKWCTTAKKTFPTGSFVWMFEYDEETQVAMSLN